MIQDKSFNGADVVRFLKHLLRHIAGKLLVIWDGLPAHQGQSVKEFLSEGGTQRIHSERLPGYAPDLNPDEEVWNYLKNVELRNLCCHDLLVQRQQVRRAIARLCHKTKIIQSFLRQAHLEPVV
jgi:transposase